MFILQGQPRLPQLDIESTLKVCILTKECDPAFEKFLN